MEETELKGCVEYIRFRNKENGWTVLSVVPEKSGERKKALSDVFEKDSPSVAVVGVMPDIEVGMTILVRGCMETSKWGRQLRAFSYEEVRPTDLDGIEQYLGSGLIKDIGPVIAHKIVRKFGEDSLDILDNCPERLIEVSGIGRKRARSIAEAVGEQKDIRSVMIWMKRHDLPNGLAMRVYKKYGKDSIRNLEDNPYRLADDFEGIGFRKADLVARAIGFDENSPLRIRSGIKCVLEEACSEGSTCLPEELLVRKAASPEYLDIPVDSVTETLDGFASDSPYAKIVREDGFVYLGYNYRDERLAAGRLFALAQANDSRRVDVDVEELGRTGGVTYEPEQAEAIRTALSRDIMIITGGPGTGKTVTTKAVIAALEAEKKTILLAAPTGRAAKRLSEVTGRPAMTIHRLLEYQGGFTRCAANPLSGDALIVDESSMIDTYLLASLLDAVPDGMKVVFVGDADQLPSVGAGNVLRDMISSGVLPTVRLTRIFRQAQGSDIVMGAHAVNEGRMPCTDNRKGTDFWFIERPDRDKVAETIRYLVEKHIPEKMGYAREGVQVLTPMRKDGDPIGATCLNRMLQDAVNKETLKLAFGGMEFRLGDRVMQTRNDYGKGVFNGDMGVVEAVDVENGCLTVSFDGVGYVDYAKAELRDLDLAYATTVHKSQGSEYPVVVMPVHRSQYVMLNRNLLYTGITRARRWCILVGTRDALALAVSREDASRRYTLLRERLTGDRPAGLPASGLPD